MVSEVLKVLGTKIETLNRNQRPIKLLSEAPFSERKSGGLNMAECKEVMDIFNDPVVQGFGYAINRLGGHALPKGS